MTVSFVFDGEATPDRQAALRDKIMANVIVFIELVLGRDYGRLNLYCNPVLHANNGGKKFDKRGKDFRLRTLLTGS